MPHAPIVRACLILLALGACAPRVLTMDGAETTAAGVPPKLALARVTDPRGPAATMELRTADGTVRVGQLGLLPLELAPASPGGPLPLGERDVGRVMAGQLAAPGLTPLDCRFRVLNPARGLDGGGGGACVGPDGLRIDFVF
jgi:hypothetical protein